MGDIWFKKQRPFGIRAFVTPLLWAGLLMLIAVCVNPYGPTMLMYPFKTVSIGVLRDYIQEWQTPEFHSIAVQPFAWLMLLTFGAVGASRQRLAFIDFALVGLFFYMGLLAGRNVALFSIVAPMVLTRHAAPALDGAANTLGIHLGWSGNPGKRSTRLNCSFLSCSPWRSYSRLPWSTRKKPIPMHSKPICLSAQLNIFRNTSRRDDCSTPIIGAVICSGACRITRFLWMGGPICIMMRSSING